MRAMSAQRTAIFTLSILALSACASAPPRTLYEQLGSQQGVAKIVDTFVELLLADPLVMDTLKDTEMKRFHRTLNEQFCVLSGGPCTYTGDSMKEVHQGFDINNAAFNALVEDLQKAMALHGVPSRAQNKLLAKLAPMQREIVNK
ncbi:group 1 truncated hemoglobin [Oxalobacteraceae bacterium CAVE-383]|nr:group 1 truncated hemoglobin [Oxalobacteraceae bacterium CAVE-383]